MAGDWIGVDHELPEKPEVLGIHERTGVPVDAILGRLFMLWRLVDRQTTDGLIRFAGPQAIAQRCGGDAEFWRVVEEVGWIQFTDDGARIPDFGRRFGQSARTRLLDATRKRAARASARQADTCPDDVRMPSGQKEDQNQTQNGPSESQSISISLSQSKAKSPPKSKNGRSAAQNVVGQKPDRSADVMAVFDHYRKYHPRSHPKPKSTSREWKAIRGRLDEGYTTSDLCQAIDGCHLTPHNLGANDRDTKYLGLELICRSGDQVSRFMENATNPPKPRNEKERRTLDAASAWLERELGHGKA